MAKVGQLRLAKVGYFFLAKVGLAKVGQIRWPKSVWPKSASAGASPILTVGKLTQPQSFWTCSVRRSFERKCVLPSFPRTRSPGAVTSCIVAPFKFFGFVHPSQRTMPSETSSRIHLAVSNALKQLVLCPSDGSLQSLVSPLHRQGLSVSIYIQTSRGLFSDSSISDGPFSFSWTTHSLHSCPCFCLSCPCCLCPLILLFGRTPTCIGTSLLSVYCCVRDLEDVLSRLRQALDPRAVRDGVL